MLYLPCVSSFISNQSFVLNLDGWFGVLTNKFIIFNILLLYYYTNHRSSIICFFVSGDTYLSLDISVSHSTISKLFQVNFFRHLWFYQQFYEQLNCISCFLNCIFWSNFNCICCRFFSMIKAFWLFFPLKFLLIFFPKFLPILLAKDKNP